MILSLMQFLQNVFNFFLFDVAITGAVVISWGGELPS